MPMFEYKCDSCGKVFERLVGRRRPNRMRCECGEIAERIMSAPNFKLPYEITLDDIYRPMQPKTKE